MLTIDFDEDITYSMKSVNDLLQQLVQDDLDRVLRSIVLFQN